MNTHLNQHLHQWLANRHNFCCLVCFSEAGEKLRPAWQLIGGVSRLPLLNVSSRLNDGNSWNNRSQQKYAKMRGSPFLVPNTAVEWSNLGTDHENRQRYIMVSLQLLKSAKGSVQSVVSIFVSVPFE